MANLTLREQLIMKILTINGTQIEDLLAYIEAIETYDESKDTMIGLLKDAPPDLSERVEDILYGEERTQE